MFVPDQAISLGTTISAATFANERMLDNVAVLVIRKLNDAINRKPAIDKEVSYCQPRPSLDAGASMSSGNSTLFLLR
jgi:hypothetical protein